MWCGNEICEMLKHRVSLHARHGWDGIVNFNNMRHSQIDDVQDV